MSPFSGLMRDIRIDRGLRQRDLADLMGYEQSYISAVERSEKGPPGKEFIDRFVRVLQLSPSEQAALLEAIEGSRRQFSIPNKATKEEYALVRKFEQQLGRLHPLQIQFIEFALRHPVSFWASESKFWPDAGCNHSTFSKEPKM